MSDSPVDEVRLIEEARQGSDQAFTALLRLHQGRVRSFLACRIPAWDVVDDLAQEIFLAAYCDLRAYNGESSLDRWLLGIARNKLLMHFREEVRRRSHESGSLESLLAGLQEGRLQSGEAQIESHEQKMSALEKCLARLPDASAELLSAYYSGRARSSELARERRKTGSALRMTVLKLRQALRECIRLRLGESGVSV